MELNWGLGDEMADFSGACVRGKTIAAVAALLLALPASQASAQQMNGFINLMGQMIQHDMQERAYKRQLQQQQQMRAEQERQQQLELRRQQIALIKRLQTALSKLGFYKSAIDGDAGPGTRAAERKFSAAFDVGQISLTEHDVAAVESYAAAGFRSKDEIIRARRGGFQTRDELLAAEAGGFSNESDFHAAQQLGFNSYDAYNAYRLSGFDSVADFLGARKGGFTDPQSYREAKAAGFSSRATFAEFKRSGLPDRASFEKHLAAQKAVKQATGSCRADAIKDSVGVMESCLSAIALGANSPEFTAAFSALGDRVSTDLEKLRPEPSDAPKVASAAATDGSPEAPSAGQYLQHYAELQAAKRGYECGQTFLQEAWRDAERACGKAEQDGSASAKKLEAQAQHQADLQQQQASEQRRQLAIKAAHKHAEQLIADLGAFAADSGNLSNPIPIAQALVQLKQVDGSDDYDAIEQSVLHLQSLLSKERAFQAYVAEKAKASEIAETNARATATAKLRHAEAFIKQYVAHHILSSHVADLLRLQKKIAGTLAASNPGDILAQQKFAQAELERLGLAKNLSDFEASLPKAASRPRSVKKAANGLAVTSHDRVLLEGNGKDVVAVGNYTPTAPHLAVNLLGKTVFEHDTADLCWAGGKPSDVRMVDLVIGKLKSLGAQSVRDGGDCTSATQMKMDVILLQRGRFLRTDVLQAKPIVDAFSAGKLKMLANVQWSDYGERAAKDAKESAAIESDVMAGLREGYGILQVANNAHRMCLVVSATDAKAQQELLSSHRDDLKLYFPHTPEWTVTSLDDAFLGIQKNSCSAVYSDASDLKRLLAGLNRAELAYHVVPRWFTPVDLASAKQKVAEAATNKAKQMASRRQEQEAEAKLAASKAADAEKVRAAQQRQLRTRYGEEAKAAFNELSDMAKRYIVSEPPSGNFGSLFPLVDKWRSARKADDWEVAHFNADLLDYGTAEWKGRRAELSLRENHGQVEEPAQRRVRNRLLRSRLSNRRRIQHASRSVRFHVRYVSSGPREVEERAVVREPMDQEVTKLRANLPDRTCRFLSDPRPHQRARQATSGCASVF